MTVYYAGIGSRKTPARVLKAMTRIGASLARQGAVLRSGGAEGADTAFECGAVLHGRGPAEIYLPSAGFNGHGSVRFGIAKDQQALAIAAEHHPNWRALSRYGQWLHGRNVYQVLGPDLQTPSDFVLCWTPGGKGGGGTGQAIRIAKAHSIPVYDMGAYAQQHLIDQIHKHFTLDIR